MLQDVVMRQGVQLKEKGEGSNIATLLQSLQAAVWAYNVRYAVGYGWHLCGSVWFERHTSKQEGHAPWPDGQRHCTCDDDCSCVKYVSCLLEETKTWIGPGSTIFSCSRKKSWLSKWAPCILMFVSSCT